MDNSSSFKIYGWNQNQGYQEIIRHCTVVGRIYCMDGEHSLPIPYEVATPLVPPFRFGMVEKGFYRGGYPVDRNFRFLRRLKLKRIISIIPSAPIADLEQFCEEEAIQLSHLVGPKVKDPTKFSVSYSVFTEFFEIVLCSDNLPIYIHCLDGSIVTGLFVMALRRLQGWHHSHYFAEFRRNYKFAAEIHLEFIQKLQLSSLRIACDSQTEDDGSVQLTNVPEWMVDSSVLQACVSPDSSVTVSEDGGEDLRYVRVVANGSLGLDAIVTEPSFLQRPEKPEHKRNLSG